MACWCEPRQGKRRCGIELLLLAALGGSPVLGFVAAIGAGRHVGSQPANRATLPLLELRPPNGAWAGTHTEDGNTAAILYDLTFDHSESTFSGTGSGPGGTFVIENGAFSATDGRFSWTQQLSSEPGSPLACEVNCTALAYTVRAPGTYEITPSDTYKIVMGKGNYDPVHGTYDDLYTVVKADGTYADDHYLDDYVAKTPGNDDENDAEDDDDDDVENDFYCIKDDAILQVRVQKQPTGTAAAMLVAAYGYEDGQALLSSLATLEISTWPSAHGQVPMYFSRKCNAVDAMKLLNKVIKIQFTSLDDDDDDDSILLRSYSNARSPSVHLTLVPQRSDYDDEEEEYEYVYEYDDADDDDDPVRHPRQLFTEEALLQWKSNSLSSSTASIMMSFYRCARRSSRQVLLLQCCWRRTGMRTSRRSLPWPYFRKRSV